MNFTIRVEVPADMRRIEFTEAQLKPPVLVHNSDSPRCSQPIIVERSVVKPPKSDVAGEIAPAGFLSDAVGSSGLNATPLRHCVSHSALNSTGTKRNFQGQGAPTILTCS